jgi:hypothetical protein
VPCRSKTLQWLGQLSGRFIRRFGFRHGVLSSSLYAI